MEEKDLVTIPYAALEREIERHEDAEKHLRSIILKLVIVLVSMLLASNLAWLWVWNQYDFSSESYTIENTDDGNANYLESGVEGVINNGIESGSEEKNGN